MYYCLSLKKKHNMSFFIFQINERIYVAGQIAMVPANLSLIEGGIRPQCRLSLRHVDRVLGAMCPSCCVDSIVACVCYVTHPDCIQVTREEWKKACQVCKAGSFVNGKDTLTTSKMFLPPMSVGFCLEGISSEKQIVSF